MKIVYFLERFPELSETFIRQEILGLLQQGISVRVVTVACSEQSNHVDLANEHPLLARCEVDVIGEQDLVYSKGRMLRWLLHPYSQGKFKQRWDNLNAKHYRTKLLYKIVSGPKRIAADEIVITHFGGAGVMAAQLKQLGYIQGPLVSVLHAYELTKLPAFKDLTPHYHKLFTQADKVLSVCRFMQDKITSLGCAREKVDVMHMGVNIEQLAQLAEYHKMDAGLLRVLFVGRLTQKKGILDALEALARVSNRVNFHFDIVGDGELNLICENSVRELELEDRVTLHGALAHHKTLQLMAQTDVLLLPSKTADNGDMEGVPVVLMEAMAMKKVVLSSFHSGIGELVDDGENGFLVAEGDIEGLSLKIELIANFTSDMRLHIGQQAVAKVSQLFNQGKQSHALASLLREL